MRCLISSSTDPYFNLATEEYFLKNSTEEIFMLYINQPCIVVGKHQNLLSEINLNFVKTNKIKLARRISGGGTVYQDLNNLNFSFIHNCPNRELINFRKFTDPILEALITLGIAAEFSGRNDLMIDNKKISGNAMHIYKSRVLSHGTLLFDSDLNQLTGSLQNSTQKYTDKSIKSVRSKVTNILPYLNHPKSIGQFTNDIFTIIRGKERDSYVKLLTDQEEEFIQTIATEKFETWDWVYGYSPQYVFRNSFSLNEITIAIELTVERGIITSCNVNTFPTNSQLGALLMNLLLNTRHELKSITEILANHGNKYSSVKFNNDEFCKYLF